MLFATNVMPHVLSAALLPSQRTKQSHLFVRLGNNSTCALWLFLGSNSVLASHRKRWKSLKHRGRGGSGTKTFLRLFLRESLQSRWLSSPSWRTQVVTMKGWQNDNFTTVLIIFILLKRLSSPGARLYNGIWVWNASDVRVYGKT